LYVNGLDYSIETDANGDYSLVAATAGSYTITPTLENHLFTPTDTILDVYDHITGLNFSDTTVFNLEGYVAASCNSYIGAAKVKFSDLSNCFDTIVSTNDTSGYYSVDLPSQKYRIELVEFVSEDEGIVTSQEVVDYFTPDTISGIVYADTSQSMIYRLPPTLTVTPEDYSVACNAIIMEQGVSGDFIFTVTEEINGQGCNTDVGFVVVEQNITTDDIVDTLLLVNGEATLSITPGEPNVTGTYLKELTVTAYIENEVVSEKLDVVVTGSVPRGSTFTTVTPSVPFLVLHDPPGDASYSYVEENTTIENTLSLSASVESSVNAWAEVKLGAKFEAGVGFTVESAIWATLKASLEVGGYVNENDEWVYSLTNTESFSTSGGDVVGSDGDVYIGGAMNLIYALTDIITYNYNTCQPEKDTKLIVAPNGFSTTYMYTEEHIAEVLIPQLEEMEEYAEADGDTTEANEYESQIEVWEQVIAQNADNVSNATFVENRSFSAGLSYESSIESSSTETMSLEFGCYINAAVAVEAGFELGGSGASAGAEMTVKMDFGQSSSESTTSTHKTGFVLEDDDSGDFFSVNILTDQVYGTPAFYTKAGRSSCPYEDNTQQREKLELSANSYREYVDSEDGQAVFLLELTNLSGSNEEQTYNLTLDPTSNPDGAIVTIGGSSVFGDVVTPYTVPPFESVYATITVSKGPLATTYSGLKFTLESSCDGSISDDIYLDVVFPSTCSNMTLASESSVATTDSAEIQLSEYDSTNIDNFFVQACKAGASTWYPLKQYDTSSLSNVTTTLNVPLTNVVDGEYNIRAKISKDDAENFSNSVSILIDRTAPIVEGLPYPLDKELEAGDVVYVTFDEYIDCGNAELEIKLLNASNGDAIVAFEYGCYNNKLIIKPDLTGVDSSNYLSVQVSGVSDVYGNINSDTTEWGFNVGNVQEIISYSDSDLDEDGIIDTEDNCELAYNPEQEDADNDGIGDVCDDDLDGDGVLNDTDNCPLIANANQIDTNNNGVGDVCESDSDGDGIIDEIDNCPNYANANQDDLDNDGTGDVCDDDVDGDGILNDIDNCPTTANTSQIDVNSNGVGDVCESLLDADNDGIIDELDNCPGTSNTNQEDQDSDGIGDVCDSDIDGDEILNLYDNCPSIANPGQYDLDTDGIGDMCDDDLDGDGVQNDLDNCPIIANALQSDMDSDGIGDSCDADIDGDGVDNEQDNCPLIANADQADANSNGVGDVCEIIVDTDSDGIVDSEDNCPTVSNADQADINNNGIGDVCEDLLDADNDGLIDEQDNCPTTSNVNQEDQDNDGIGDVCDTDIDGDEIPNLYDNCELTSNRGQYDFDNDGIGDMCDDDLDGDGIENDIDNCPVTANASQSDIDGDGIGDSCDADIDGDGVSNQLDNCPDVANPDQADTNDNGIGDVCESIVDTDQDGIADSEDNCPSTSNPNQTDTNNNGIGDVCENLSDTDNDGILDEQDNCPNTSNPNQEDQDNDGIGDVCDVDIDGDEIINLYDNCETVSNSGQYDFDGDGIGDMCDDDLDGDDISNDVDNCPIVANALQGDIDGDGIGDTCDTDMDGDGINNELDNCPTISNPDQEDSDNDGTGDVCELTDIISPEISIINVFPNPVNNELYIHLSSEERKNITVELVDLVGKTHLSVQIGLVVGKNVEIIQVESLTSGVYICRVSEGDDVYLKKIVKL
jgi:hypothetical protein